MMQGRAAVPSHHFGVPAGDATEVDRVRLHDLIGCGARVVLVVAPSGYGKTALARQCVARSSETVAWVSLPSIDHDRLSVWSAILHAVRAVLPDVDDEAELALVENPRSKRFVSILIERISRSVHRGVVVLDDVSALADRDVLDELVHVVERGDDKVRWLLTSRDLPTLPLARWRTAGLLVELTEEQMGFDDEEARAVASARGQSDLPDELVVAINDAVGGWPIAVDLALGAARPTDEPAAVVAHLGGPGFDLLGQLLDQVLAPLSDDVADGASVLSIVERIDTELANELLGERAGPVIGELRQRRLLPSASPDRPDVLCFSPLLRTLLEQRLRWRDPVRFDDLHRRAAKVHERRHEYDDAYRHLRAVGDIDAANALVLEPALQLVNRGDRVGLGQLLRTLPPLYDVVDPGLALDFAHTAFFAGSPSIAYEWCARAQALGAVDGGSMELRYHSARAILALMDGHLTAAQRHVDAFVALEPHAATVGPLEQRFATIGARLALVTQDLPAARHWVDRAGALSGSEIVTSINGPGLLAWFDVRSGRLQPALQRLATVLEAVDRLGVRPHHGAFDALVTAAWAHFGSGDLASAAEMADAAREDAERLGSDWNVVRAGLVTARIRAVTHGPRAAMALLRDVRAGLRHPASDLARHLDVMEARALVRLGRSGLAIDLATPLAHMRMSRLVLASAAVAESRRADVETLLDGSQDWPTPDRLEAMVLRAASLPGRSGAELLCAALDEASLTGWVSPFLGQGGRVDDLLLGLPHDHLPDRLSDVLRAGEHRPPARSDVVEQLTARERTILQLLPTHLSYVEIGERLFVSVNTVKSNLKSIYRKLGVTTRSGAVAAARSAGLL
jgi:LuxR family maltose regulon positive regulatory protein